MPEEDVAQAGQGGEKMKAEMPMSLEEMSMLNAAFRTSGLSIDLASTAVIYKLVDMFKVRKGDMSLKEINTVVEKVLRDPQFAPAKEKE